MVLFNYATKEITMKVVYYGPGLCGKTTNLQHIHARLNPKTRGKLISLATETDRTLFFDFLPMELGSIKGFKVRFQLYTVPGQVIYNATRKLVLKGSDGVVFVADSQKALMNQNIESFENLKENLFLNGIDPNEIPLVLQFNKRDLPDVSPVSELNAKLNHRGGPYFESIATIGDGVLETFKEITRILLKKISEKHSVEEFKGEIVPEVATAKDKIEEIAKPIEKDIPSAVEVEEGIAEETTSAALEPEETTTEVLEVAEYPSETEEVTVTEDSAREEYKYPAIVETPLEEKPSATESFAPEVKAESFAPEEIETFPREKTFDIESFAPIDIETTAIEKPPAIESYAQIEIETTAREKPPAIEPMPPVAGSGDEKPPDDTTRAAIAEFSSLLKEINKGLDLLSEFLPEFKKTQENILKIIIQNESAHRRRTEEILKSLSEIKDKLDSLGEKPKKGWFGRR